MQFSPATLKLCYLPLGFALIGTAALAALLWQDPRQLGYLVPLAAFAGLALVGLSDHEEILPHSGRIFSNRKRRCAAIG